MVFQSAIRNPKDPHPNPLPEYRARGPGAHTRSPAFWHPPAASLQSSSMRRYFPDFEGFAAAAEGADVVPVYRQLLADRLTPVSAFEVLGRDPHAFLLESVLGGEKIARYSFIATAPSLVYQAAGGKALVTRPGSYRLGGEAIREFDTTDPL